MVIVQFVDASDFKDNSANVSLIERCITQDQGAWIIDYRLRHKGCNGVIVCPEEIGVRIEGWVSNSRVASHTVPRWSSLLINHGLEVLSVAEVIAAPDDGSRCRERLIISAWTEDDTPPVSVTATREIRTSLLVSKPISSTVEWKPILPLSLAPKGVAHLRLRLEHQHVLCGEYDPLLGARAVELKLGSALVHDVLPLDREQYVAQPRFSWPEPPIERRDTHHFLSAPDSLHIEAHNAGHQRYHYPERPVRYSTKMHLRFWYLIAAGTEGECCVGIAQYKETPTSWRKLVDGSFEQTLRTMGRWTKFERVVQTEAEATTLTLEFKIVGESDVGEMWIDDVSLEPVGCGVPTGP
jgi:hypothetical protein